MGQIIVVVDQCFGDCGGKCGYCCIGNFECIQYVGDDFGIGCFIKVDVYVVVVDLVQVDVVMLGGGYDVLLINIDVDGDCVEKCLWFDFGVCCVQGIGQCYCVQMYVLCNCVQIDRFVKYCIE